VIAYVVPLRCESCTPPGHGGLVSYLATLRADAEVIVADTSPADVAAMHASRFRDIAEHVPVARTSLNGKVDGVHAGVRRASAEVVIVADDDVRYDIGTMRAVAAALGSCDLVIPQNVFPRGQVPWHARWDSARSLLNRAFGTDYPGTLAVRRSMFVAAGGYDGDVLFENLEMIRTIQAAGGMVRARPDLFVLRLPPTADRFLEQRVRQAYDDFARPVRLAVALATVPLMAAAIARGRWRALAVAGLGAVAIAEAGRRRAGGAAHVPATTPLFAPPWLLERGVTSWLAVWSRLVRGGCVYRGTIIRRAATSRRELRRRQRLRRRASRRTTASFASGRSGTAARSLAAG
jgi:hypothetical protein